MDEAAQYPVFVEPLPDEDGGGFLAKAIDLPGCIGDGATPEAAVKDVRKAIIEWIDEYRKIGRDVPRPGSLAVAFRAQWSKEMQTIKECVERLRDAEKSFDSLEDRIAALERNIEYLVDETENVAGWDRFHVVFTKIVGRPRTDLLC